MPAVSTRWAQFRAWAVGLRPAWKATFAFAAYLAFSIAFWTGSYIADFATRHAGIGGADGKLYMWSLRWVPWALTNGRSPLFTDRVFAPDGLDLTWVTFLPGPALVMWPVTHLFGQNVSLNLLLTVAPALAGWAAYLVCSRLTGRFWPSFAGGYLFGFGTYMVGHMQGHVNLVLLFPAPLAVYLVIRYVQGSLGRVAFVAWLTLTMLGLFSVSTEVFATTVAFGAAAFALAVLAAGEARVRVLRAGLLTAASLGATAVVLLPFALPALRYAPEQTIRPVERTSVDLLSFILPRGIMLVRTEHISRWTARFTSNQVEDAAYLGVFLLAMLVGFAITERRRRGTWALLGFIGVVGVLALGPVLHVAGRETIAMPGELLTNAPLLEHATPQRFPVYASLAVGVVAALWLSRARGRWAWVRWALVIAGAVTLLPRTNVSPAFHPSYELPAFIEDGSVTAVLGRDENVFVITEHFGEHMGWQAEAWFWYRMPQGYLGPVPDDYAPIRLNRGLSGDQPFMFMPTPDEMARYLEGREATAIVLDDAVRWKFEPLLRAMSAELAYEGGGVTVWREPAGGYARGTEPEVTFAGTMTHDGGELKSFSLPLATGDRLTYDEVRGRPIVFMVVPATCDGCGPWLDELRAFAAAHPGLATIAVAGYGGNASVAQPLLADDLTVLVDPLGRFSTALGTERTPHMLVVGADGIVTDVFAAGPADEWRERLEGGLSEDVEDGVLAPTSG